MTTHTIRKGFDLRLAGAAAAECVEAPEPARVEVLAAAFPGIKGKALVAQGEVVATGQPLFADKHDPDLVVASPATGAVAQLEFGERRALVRITIDNAAARGGVERFADVGRPDGDRAALVRALRRAGLWPLFRQRPVGTMPDAAAVPVAIYVNGMDTAPLAADPVFATRGRLADLQAGVDVLQRLGSGQVYLTLRAGEAGELHALRGVEVHEFRGPHPAGLVGTHIHRIRPLRAGETCWSLRAQDLVRLGVWARTGHYPAAMVVATAGSAAPLRRYWRVRQGAGLAVLTGGAALGGDVRVVDGTVLHGSVLPPDGCLSFATTTVTVIPEGEGRRDLFGWARPGFAAASASRSVFGWLRGRRDHVVDARLHGGHRAIVDLGTWADVVPLDVHVLHLVRAILADDLDEALALGLLELTEEDVALCTFADPCKRDVGAVIRRGLDLYLRER